MHILAAAATATQSTVDRLKQIPFEFWWKLALGIGIVFAVVILLRKIAKVNKVVLGVGVFVVVTLFGFTWIYERNEPGWASPAVNWLAGFFPSKGKV
jgi:hypothetical protein